MHDIIQVKITTYVFGESCTIYIWQPNIDCYAKRDELVAGLCCL